MSIVGGTGGSIVLGQPGSGAGQTTLQRAYDNSQGADPMILLNTTPTPISIQASVSGSILEIRDVGNANTIFEVDADPDLIVARAGITIDNAFTNGAASSYLTFSDTFTTGGGYLGGCILSNGTITYDNSFFIWALLQESKIYQAAAGPGFAAFTLFNALAVIRNSGNFDLVQALVLNAGVTHQRITSGTSLTAQNTGLSFAGGLRTTVSGAIMRYTGGPYAVVYTPNYGTVAGSTVDFENCKAVWARNPSVALFQPSAGVEVMNSYVALEIDNITFGGNVTKRGIRSALAAATNARFIESTGTAESDHAGNFNLDSDFPNGILRQGASPTSDYQQGYVGGTDQFFQQLNNPAVSQLRHSSPSTDRWLIEHALGGGEFNWSCDRFSLGDQTGANGNQVGNFVTPARTIGVAGEWADFLLTQGGNLTVGGLSMSRVSAWVINGVSYASSSGSVSNADTLTVGGFPTSAPGVTITERQSLHVIAGRSRLQSAMQYDPINPAALSAGDNNDWGGLLTGTANNGMRHWARVTPDGGGTSVITGIDSSSAQDGDCFKITNIGTVSLTIGHQDAASSASNRIISPTAADFVLSALQSCEVIWDATTDRWRLLYGSGA